MATDCMHASNGNGVLIRSSACCGPQAKMAKVVVAVNVAFLAAVVAVALLALHGGARLFAVGLLCAALTVGMYAAPLGAMVSILYTPQ